MKKYTKRKINLIFRILICAQCLFLYVPSFAIIGPLINDHQMIPPQLCSIIPTAPSKYAMNPKYFCGGIIIDKSHLLTASHCVFLPYTEGRIDCNGGDKDLRFLRSKAKVRNPNGAFNPVGTYTPDKIGTDLAILVIEDGGEFQTPPARLINENYNFKRLSEAIHQKKCIFAGVGVNSYVPFGPAHVGLAPSNQIKKLLNGISLEGFPHVAAHDSGGGFFCELDGIQHIVGTIVGRLQQGSVIAGLNDSGNHRWLIDTLKKSK